MLWYSVVFVSFVGVLHISLTYAVYSIALAVNDLILPLGLFGKLWDNITAALGSLVNHNVEQDVLMTVVNASFFALDKLFTLLLKLSEDAIIF